MGMFYIKFRLRLGTRTDITVTRWNAYFEEPEDPSEVTHDGYAVFVMDNTGWDALTLYAWGNDLPELFWRLARYFHLLVALR